MSSVDADVYWKSIATGSTDYGFTPSFQAAGEQTLPVELLMYNSLMGVGSNATTSVSCSWGQGIASNARQGQYGSVVLADAQGTSLSSRVGGNVYLWSSYLDADIEEECNVRLWGYANDGRSIYVDQRHNDVSHYAALTSLRMGEQPWILRGNHCDTTTESNWQIPFGFAPDWVWCFSATPNEDAWTSPIYEVSGVHFDTFAHRDGTIECNSVWDQDGQSSTNCGTYYDTSNFVTQYWNNALFAQITTATFEDWGMTLNVATNGPTDNSYINGWGMGFLAGKNANSKVGHFQAYSGDSGWRSSDSTVKITTGFRPRIIFLRGGNRSYPGHTVHWVSTRGFIGPEGADQWSQSMVQQDNDGTSDVYGANYNDRCFHQLTYNGGVDCTLDFNTMEDDGFRLNVTNLGSTNISYLAIGDPPDAVVPAYGESIL